MAQFSTRHYEAIAEVFHAAFKSAEERDRMDELIGICAVREFLIDAFMADNPRFDPAGFTHASSRLRK